MIQPPREFRFAAETFNLYLETTQDGERVAREQAEQARRDEARRRAITEHPTLALREEPASLTDIFGPPIYTYTRAQAIADGFQIEVTKTAQEAGIRFPMFITRAVFDNYVAVPPDVSCQDEAGRLWDVVWMTRFAIIRSRQHGDRIPVALYVRNADNRPARLVKLVAVCGALDIDDPQPAITVMMPDED